jgi:hypothetical protein
MNKPEAAPPVTASLVLIQAIVTGALNLLRLKNHTMGSLRSTVS